MAQWIRRRFRDQEVLAECRENGDLIANKGLVRFMYRAGGKTYNTRPDRLERIEGATPESGEPGGGATAKRSSGGKKKASTKASGLTWVDARPEDEAVQLWTDGACTGNPGPAGLGVVYRHKGEEQELSEYLGQGTNNIAELTAILRGLALVEDADTPVDVVTDSSYAIGLLTKGWKAKKNQELVAELRRELERLSDVRFLKVPGHAGVLLNERADELARTAITRGY